MKNHELVRQIDAALAAHGSWHSEVSIEIRRGAKALAPEHLGNAAICSFGQWLSDDTLDERIRSSQAYVTVLALHADCHRMMGEITRLAQDGRAKDANALLKGQCKTLHADLEEALIALRAQVTHRRAA